MSGKYPIPRCRQCGEPRYDAHSRQNGLCKDCKVKVRRAYMKDYMRANYLRVKDAQKLP
jgi:hypothetical protein